VDFELIRLSFFPLSFVGGSVGSNYGILFVYILFLSMIYLSMVKLVSEGTCSNTCCWITESGGDSILEIL
jgi:hypothetical protein